MSLRNPNINYKRGWFFVTSQAMHNKTMFGVIAKDECHLNALGKRLVFRWRDLFNHRPGLVRDEFVVMPNHFHAVIRLAPEAGKRVTSLSEVMQIFKSFTGNEYLALLRGRQCPDIGAHLWRESFYDNLITSREELENIRSYIRDNPARWERDRFGPVTAYHYGNFDLLGEPLVAFVASDGGDDARGDEAPPLRYEGVYLPREARQAGGGARGAAGGGKLAGAGAEEGRGASHIVAGELRLPRTGAQGAAAPPPVVISTFTSRHERKILAKCLAAGRRYIHVLPAGLPAPLPPAWRAACEAGQALLISPSPPGTALNKQRAIWCNQYVLDHAGDIWHGRIRPGGTLETLLRQRGRCRPTP